LAAPIRHACLCGARCQFRASLLRQVHIGEGGQGYDLASYTKVGDRRHSRSLQAPLIFLHTQREMLTAKPDADDPATAGR
jgi:choline/glycine/proline betaine transport protein